MENGSIVLVSLPQADGRMKNRPAVVLGKLAPFGDFLVCGVSSQIHNKIDGVDEIVEESSADFRDTRLKGASVIRVLYLGTLPSYVIKGRMGKISQMRLQRIYRSLEKHFGCLGAASD